MAWEAVGGDGGMTARARFSQADVRKAIRAAKKEGELAPRVILRPNGEIEIICGKTPPANDEEEFDL